MLLGSFNSGTKMMMVCWRSKFKSTYVLSLPPCATPSVSKIHLPVVTVNGFKHYATFYLPD
jgi:hypothetical protein